MAGNSCRIPVHTQMPCTLVITSKKYSRFIESYGTFMIEQLNSGFIAIRSLPQPLRQSPAVESLRLGWYPHEPHVPRLQTASDASYTDTQPNFCRCRRHRHPAVDYKQVKT